MEWCIFKKSQSPVASSRKGITYIEAIIGVALFSMVALLLFSTYQRVFVAVRASQVRVVATALADEQIEFIRNLPYAQVGTQGGIPFGAIPPVQNFIRGGMTFVATTTVRNIDHAFDGVAGGTPNDLSPADNKLVELEIFCLNCANFRPIHFSTMVAPKSLENASTNGSLFVQVIDASGQPVSGANVHIHNSTTVPPINIMDVTATSGVLQIIDAPPSVNSYEIYVSKSGYSADFTSGAPTSTNPVKAHATVAVQTVTQVTLSIDRNATMEFRSVSPSCAIIPDVDVEIVGSKLVNASPDTHKHVSFHSTGVAAAITVPDIEWDTYMITASSSLYDLAGVMPLLPLAIFPGATQHVDLVLVPKSPKSVLVTVKDASTGLPISGADVTLERLFSSTTLVTGRGFLKQTDWSGGFGQSFMGDETRYFADDGNLDVLGTPGEIKLFDLFGSYPNSGTLESSTFDTGSASNFYQFTFFPPSQPDETGMGSARFQIATGNGTSSWTYLGPDGTSASYYTATATDINASHNDDRYLRYKLFLSTASTSFTPSVSDTMFTFTSLCVPPGQVIFQSLSNGTYTLTVSKSGYTDYSDTVVVDASTLWQEKTVSLTP
jgi:type II secretory pathway pseudopilin PulG